MGGIAKTIIRIIIMIIPLPVQRSMPPRSTGFEFPGVIPSRQQRSRETTAALLRAGAEMLHELSLASLSIEALCAEVGATVGAFYSRFESKEAYFNTLLELAARDGNALLSQSMRNDRLADAKLGELCRLLVDGMVGWMRGHQGVLRAALQHNDIGPDRWTRFKELGRTAVAGATPVLLRAMGRDRRAAKSRTIAFGFQVTFGTLVNAILNDPGPLSIHDDEMAVRLSACLLQLLEAELRPPSKISARKRNKLK
jgi:AcrR family transcriptional regulator